MAAAPPSDQLGALQWFAPPLLHVYPAPAQSFPDLKTTLFKTGIRRHARNVWHKLCVRGLIVNSFSYGYY